MTHPIILASGSETRKKLLQNAGVSFEAIAARVDEHSIRDALVFEGASPRDLADTLAEMKARKVSEKRPDALVIGCDQVVDFEGRVIGKSETCESLKQQLREMRGKEHNLLSAVVIYHEAEPIWRHIGKVRMTVRNFSDRFLDDYLDRNWPDVRHAAGGYMLEGEGVRLFSSVNGDYFTVLGLPLVELLSFLTERGAILR
jgi:septum formation protein